MVILLCTLLIAVGFVIGAAVAAIWFNSAAQKAKGEWRQKRKELETQIFQLKQQLAEKEQLHMSTNENVIGCGKKQGEEDPFGQQKAVVQKKQPSDTDKPIRKSLRLPETISDKARKDLKSTYAEFSACESLSVDFQPSFPDNLLFRPGPGYIRNQQNELIPAKSSIDGINTTTGYALEGLFRIFDVIYNGSEYNFSQIQTGAMGTSYVKVQSIIATAKIRKTGQEDIFVLDEKGILEVVDA